MEMKTEIVELCTIKNEVMDYEPGQPGSRMDGPYYELNYEKLALFITKKLQDGWTGCLPVGFNQEGVISKIMFWK